MSSHVKSKSSAASRHTGGGKLRECRVGMSDSDEWRTAAEKRFLKVW
jgi:hypothetical protein